MENFIFINIRIYINNIQTCRKKISYSDGLISRLQLIIYNFSKIINIIQWLSLMNYKISNYSLSHVTQCIL